MQDVINEELKAIFYRILGSGPSAAIEQLAQHELNVLTDKMPLDMDMREEDDCYIAAPPAEPEISDADLAYFHNKLTSCEARYGVGSPECHRSRKQLEMLEDAILTSRLKQAPERKVYYIDIPTGTSVEKANAIITEAKKSFKTASFNEEDYIHRHDGGGSSCGYCEVPADGDLAKFGLPKDQLG